MNMEGLAGAASIIAVVQIASDITKICDGYLHDVRHARKEIEQMQSQCQSLKTIIQRLQEKPQLQVDKDAVEQCCQHLNTIKI